jgi:hypothetical protein
MARGAWLDAWDCCCGGESEEDGGSNERAHCEEILQNDDGKKIYSGVYVKRLWASMIREPGKQSCSCRTGITSGVTLLICELDLSWFTEFPYPEPSSVVPLLQQSHTGGYSHAARPLRAMYTTQLAHVGRATLDVPLERAWRLMDSSSIFHE